MAGGNPSMREIRVTNQDAGPYGISTGPDAALWLTLVHAGRIGRLSPGGEFDDHPLDSAGCGPSLITPGPDGALWFTRSRDHRIGRITTDGRPRRSPPPRRTAGPSASPRARTAPCGSPR